MENPFNRIEQKVGKRLTKQYIAALVIVALLTLFGHTIIQTWLFRTVNNSHIVNLAGKQRMLSQQLVKLALIKYEGEPLWNIEYQQEYENIKSEWVLVHYGLKNDTLRSKNKVQNSTIINTMYAELEPTFITFNNDLTKYLENSDKSNSLISTLLKTQKNYLEKMDQIVNQYDIEASNKVATIRMLEYLILGLTLITLIIEFFYIFKPITKYVQTIIYKLSESEKRVTSTNINLTVSNKRLLQTQNELAISSKEKFDLIRKEDKIRSTALLEGQEEERKRISREIHDGLGQMLTGIKLGMWKLKQPNMDQKLQKAYDHLKDLVDETIITSRNISFNLMPTSLNDFGLISALKILIAQWQQRHPIEIELISNEPQIRLEPQTEINLYRIFQEGLHNIIKHSKSTKAKIIVNKTENTLELSITDNGIGFDNNKVNLDNQSIIHNGIKNMKTRVNILNGTFKLTNVINEGTDIFIKLPIETFDK